MLASARSLTAIGEWITDALAWALRSLGFVPDPLTGHVPVPHPATVRRVLERLDGDALDRAPWVRLRPGVLGPESVNTLHGV